MSQRVLFQEPVVTGEVLSREEKVLLAQTALSAPSSFSESVPQRNNTSVLPKGRIGNVSIGRLICGGNLIRGYAHTQGSVFVSSLLKDYFSEERIFGLLEQCEEQGIDTVVTNVSPDRGDMEITRILGRYWDERRGKIHWIAQCQLASPDDMETVQIAVDRGAVGAFLMGVLADRWTKNQCIDRIGRVVDFFRKNGLIAGVAGHLLCVPMECEKAGVNPDFYVKTFHSNPNGSTAHGGNRTGFVADMQSPVDREMENENRWCTNPAGTAEFMKSVKKPWIAYKVLAAGAIDPQDGFRFAFENGADFVLAGMFDFQIAEDVQIVRKILSGTLNREREWFA